jgi:hypothetical protein
MAKRKVQSRTTRRSPKPATRASRRRAIPKKAARPAGRSAKKTAKSGKKSVKKAVKTRVKKVVQPAARRRAPAAAKPAPYRQPEHREATRLNRPRRQLDDGVPTPPSSLDLDRHASAARTGRAGAAEHRADHANLTPSITAGDADVNVEDAYFTGDEAPGGDNSTPDQDVVDEIGKAIGVEYQDDEELRGSDKVSARDKHRWELDPASSEDYRDRKKP